MTARRYVDACVHPFVTDSDQLRDYLMEPWRSRAMPAAVDRAIYQPPFPELVAEEPLAAALPGSDPGAVRRRLFKEGGADYAVLLPLTRGLLPDTRQEVAIAAATNDWLDATWLGAANPEGRFKGSIRICPREAKEAVREIERWAGHPHFVQVAVPLEALTPYGAEMYFPIWAAAARHGLPVAVHGEGQGTGVELAPTPVGYPTHFMETFALAPTSGAVHLASLICEGVFERLADLCFVFADGGYDVCGALLWRLDKDWRGSRADVPWTQRQPSEYLLDHVRFVLTRWDEPTGRPGLNDVIEIWSGGRLLLYASNYPYWDELDPAHASSALPESWREPVMSANALELYGLAR